MSQRHAIRVLCGFVASALVVGCGIPEEQYNAKVMEADRLKKELAQAALQQQALEAQLDTVRQENRTLAGRLSELGDDVAKLLGEKSALSTDLEQTRDREARLKREQEAQRARMAKYRQVIEKFKSLVSSGKLKIRIQRGQMVVEMASNILFDVGKADLSEEGKIALGELSKVLMTITDRNFQVAGHTDNVPIESKRFPSNWELSTARAVTVVKFLQQGGVDAVHLSAAGYAEFMPAKSNDSEDGRSANRRIEITLMPNLDELPDLSGLEGEVSE
ncbi:MAG: OmpA family protein [Proteobacteria bacterium]|jgi:chemotaxis protein MotB|nr:OmpA family protein [Pseudomonadota bacterium]